jgi:hypothetical protein
LGPPAVGTGARRPVRKHAGQYGSTHAVAVAQQALAALQRGEAVPASDLAGAVGQEDPPQGLGVDRARAAGVALEAPKEQRRASPPDQVEEPMIQGHGRRAHTAHSSAARSGWQW